MLFGLLVPDRQPDLIKVIANAVIAMRHRNHGIINFELESCLTPLLLRKNWFLSF